MMLTTVVSPYKGDEWTRIKVVGGAKLGSFPREEKAVATKELRSWEGMVRIEISKSRPKDQLQRLASKKPGPATTHLEQSVLYLVRNYFVLCTL